MEVGQAVVANSVRTWPSSGIALALIIAVEGCFPPDIAGFSGWIESDYPTPVMAVVLLDPAKTAPGTTYSIPPDGQLHRIPFVDVQSAGIGVIRFYGQDCRLLNEILLEPGHFHVVLSADGSSRVERYPTIGPSDTPELTPVPQACIRP